MSPIGRLGAAFGVLGVLVLVVQPLFRLTPYVLEAIRGGLTGFQWTVLCLWVLVNAHAEGWRGFHQRFAPRVVVRAYYLGRNPRPHWVLLAPLFCMSLFHASRRGLLVARLLVVGIVLLVLAVRQLSQPWRGIVDAGVVAGLGLGALSLVVHLGRALLGRLPDVPPDLPLESDPESGPASGRTPDR
ncbi:hypothetical protein [Paraliomyxa miuraensis]|uniref:hypothetical protein n=1 Tax=Paraliomyxa miuraensis TaxID=376150 RepID=UPI0022504D5D|nr:hypothetical protein [Paraliomyxa miuraensis]MCX4242483.1 hypothetical protein [Paraliomyxa miuraensis]